MRVGYLLLKKGNDVFTHVAIVDAITIGMSIVFVHTVIIAINKIIALLTPLKKTFDYRQIFACLRETLSCPKI